MQRQRHHGPPRGGGHAVGVERAQPHQQPPGLVQGAGRGRVEERQVAGVGAPHRQLQRQPGEVGLADLRLPVAPAGRVLDLGPQPHRHARSEAPGPPRPLVGRRARGGDRLQPGEAGGGVEQRRPGQPGVDHDAHPLDRQAGLGDVGGQHHLAAARQAGDQRRVLGARGQRSVERVDVDRRVRAERFAQRRGGALDLGRAGQEDQHVALGLAAQDLAHRRGGGRLDVLARAPGRPAHVHRVGPALAGHQRGGLAVAAQQRRHPVAVEGGRHDQDAQVGPQVAAGVQRQGQAQVGVQAALVELVEHHQGHALQPRVPLEPAGQDALGQHLHPRGRPHGAVVAGAVADRLAHRLPPQRGHAPGRGPGGQPAGLQHHDAVVAPPRLVQQGQRAPPSSCPPPGAPGARPRPGPPARRAGRGGRR